MNLRRISFFFFNSPDLKDFWSDFTSYRDFWDFGLDSRDFRSDFRTFVPIHQISKVVGP